MCHLHFNARILLGARAALMAAMLLWSGWLAADEPLKYNREIRPILAKHCFVCHGPDEGSRQAGLRLDDRAAAIEMKAIQPGRPAQSGLVERIQSTDPESVMPPADSGHSLSADEIKRLRQWVAEGAKYEIHWSFAAPKKTDPPTNQADGSNHPIDRFVHRHLEAAQLSPTAEADQLTLIRRLSLDLTGLPPTVEEADAFAADRSPEAYETVVDRLLASDAYGEHWSRMWLDLARYADTKGYEKDRPRTIWRYRDWVIDAFNRDMPYDQFTTEQLAGDLLSSPTNEQFLATAFHRNTMENDEGGTDDEEFRVAAVKDRVDTTLQVWMGLTMGCAKCHSHKYDPISQHAYYQMYALFNQTEDADREQPLLKTPTREQQDQIQRLEGELKTLQQALADRPPGYAEAFSDWQAKFKGRPLWAPLLYSGFESNQGIELTQDNQGVLLVDQELPEKDTWKLTLQLPPGQPLTSIRIDTFPKPKGGKWNDKNVVLNEFKVELIEPGQDPVPCKLVRPRADFSQRDWPVAKAIDGQASSGWAFSPQAGQAHAAVFDFEQPIEPGTGRQLRLTLQQQYGAGLLLKRFRISASNYPASWLAAEVKIPSTETLFETRVFPATRQLHANIAAKRKEITGVRQAVPSTPVMRELAADKRRQTRIHVRGNFLDLGDPVEGSVPEGFGRFDAAWPRNRLGVARWLINPANPLTSRVAVNRIWAQLFGRGFVETEEDFGTQGTLPSHPELLDWLAVDFQENGWSLKRLLKTIVMSRTYRQSSHVSPQRLEIDPGNRLLSRGPRFRLSAEIVRDQAMAVSGLLTRQIGGPSVMPPQPGGIWKSTYSGEKWKNATGADRYRRALYTYKKRTSPYPAMLTFDSGSGEVCQIRRVRTNTPLQALVTLNDTVYVEAAGALATRMEHSASTSRDRIANGFRMVLVRHADPKELDRLVALYDSLETELTDGDALLQSAGLTEGDPRLVAVANVLLNLDETLMKQ